MAGRGKGRMRDVIQGKINNGSVGKSEGEMKNRSALGGVEGRMKGMI